MPPLTLENASALVLGGVRSSDIEKERKMLPAQQTQPKTQNVRVLRSFYFQGKPTKVNETIEVPRTFALELKAAHKAEFVEPKPEPEAKKPEAKAGQKALV